MNELTNKLREEFKDKETRRIYVDDFLNTQIATQIKVLREQRGLTQAELAALAGMRQERISVLEDVDYSSWTINVLRRLAEAFDLRLSVKFESFGSYLHEFENFSRESLERPSFDEDLEFHGIPQTTSTYIYFDTNALASLKQTVEYLSEWRAAAAHSEIQPFDIPTAVYEEGEDTLDLAELPEIPIPQLPIIDYSSQVIG